MTVQGLGAIDAAAVLDREYGIQVRAGYQCAALLHRVLGTYSRGGSIRISFGPFNSDADVDAAVEAIRHLAGQRGSRATDPARCRCIEGANGPSQVAEPGHVVPAVTASPARDVGQRGLPRSLDQLVPGLKDLWAQTLGDPEVTIAVLDGPVDLSHPALGKADLRILRTPLSTSCRADGPACHHGTHVASILFGQRDGPFKGVAPGCSGVVAPIFRDGRDGRLGPSSQLDLALAISAALDAGANVINVSGGELSRSCQAHPLLNQVLNKCRQRGVLVVAAAGNDGCRCLHVPGAAPSVLAVGAMDANGNPLEFSNWGDAYRVNGVLAPGGQIPGAVPGGGGEVRTGTSFAAPIVAGVAALLLSLQRARGQMPDCRIVKQAILRSALGCDQPVESCNRLLAGRLNVARAVSFITSGESKMSQRTTLRNSLPQQARNGSLPPSSKPRGGPRLQAAACSCGGQDAEDHELEEFEEQEVEDQWEEEEVDDDLAAESQDEDDLLDPFAALQQPSRARKDSKGAQRRLAARPPSGQRSTKRHRYVADANLRPSARRPAEPRRRPRRQPGVMPSYNGDVGPDLPPLVYALGTLGYDFGSEARHDSIQLNLPHDRFVENPEHLLEHLDANEHVAESIIFTLNFDLTPIYAIQPAGAFAAQVYKLLRDFLRQQLKEGVERISVPGIIVGETMLFSGQVVPVVVPDQRALFSWSTAALSRSLRDQVRAVRRDVSDETLNDELSNFLNRIYYEFRNLGVSPEDRALNFAGTNAILFVESITGQLGRGLQLDEITVSKSAFCRPDSDCWDVSLIFYKPDKQLEEARHQTTYTVDVSDVIPVIVGPRREFRVH